MLVKLPLATLVLMIVVQMLAWALEDTPYRRHDLDLLALNVEHIAFTPSPQIVIVGDSVTQDILKTYQIGDNGQVANLTTNQASGLIGSYFLLNRYLQANHAPKVLLIASTPEFFTYLQDKATAEVYLTSVFNKSNELDILKNSINQSSKKFIPALYKLKPTIGLKLLAFFASAPSGLLMGNRKPNPEIDTPKLGTTSASLETDIIHRGETALQIPQQNTLIIKRICDLAATRGFSIYVQNAPIAVGTREIWTKKNYLSEFDSMRKRIIGKHCKGVLWNIGAETPVVPNGGMRDAYHLARHDWTNVYAVFLNQLVMSLVSP